MVSLLIGLLFLIVFLPLEVLLIEVVIKVFLAVLAIRFLKAILF